MLIMKTPSVAFGIAFALLSRSAFAAGLVPSVNADMGCTTAGQVVQYNGSTLTCAPPTRPLATIGAGGSQLPTCNSGTKGAMYIVTDALTPVAIATAVGGGAVSIGVTCNGTNWIVQ
jgi:hypothetical protein